MPYSLSGNLPSVPATIFVKLRSLGECFAVVQKVTPVVLQISLVAAAKNRILRMVAGANYELWDDSSV